MQCWVSSAIVNDFQFSCSVMSDSLRPHGLQHGRPPWPSPTPGVYSDSCPLSWWCHLTISSFVFPFSSRLLSFQALGSFQMSQFFTSSGQRIGVSASTSILPMNVQDWFPLGWTGWLSLQSKGLSRVFSSTTVQKHHFSTQKHTSVLSFLYSPTLTSIHDYRKNHSLIRQTFVGKVMSLLFNMLSRLVCEILIHMRAFLTTPRNVSYMRSHRQHGFQVSLRGKTMLLPGS